MNFHRYALTGMLTAKLVVYVVIILLLLSTDWTRWEVSHRIKHSDAHDITPMIFFWSVYARLSSSSETTNKFAVARLCFAPLKAHGEYEYGTFNGHMLHIPIGSTILAGFICSAVNLIQHTFCAEPESSRCRCTSTSIKTIGPINIITAKFVRFAFRFYCSSVCLLVRRCHFIQFSFDSSFCFQSFFGRLFSTY